MKKLVLGLVALSVLGLTTAALADSKVRLTSPNLDIYATVATTQSITFGLGDSIVFTPFDLALGFNMGTLVPGTALTVPFCVASDANFDYHIDMAFTPSSGVYSGSVSSNIGHWGSEGLAYDPASLTVTAVPWADVASGAVWVGDVVATMSQVW